MNNLFVSLSMIPLQLILFFIFKKRGIIKKEWAQPLSFVGFNIGLTSLIFLAFLRAPVTGNTLLNPFVGFLFAGSVFAIGFVMAKLFHISDNYKPIFISSMATFEGGGIGYPFFIAIFGAQNLPQIALLDLGMAIFAFTIITFYFYRSTVGTQGKLSEQFIKILKIPLLWAMVLGLIFNLIGVRIFTDNIIGEAIIKLIETLSAIAIPLILASVILNLDVDLKTVKRTLPFSFGSIAITFVLAIIWSFVWKVLPLSLIAKGALLIMSLLPPSLYISVLAQDLNLSEDNKKYATQLFSVTVFISIIILLIVSSFIPKLITLW